MHWAALSLYFTSLESTQSTLMECTQLLYSDGHAIAVVESYIDVPIAVHPHCD